MTWGQTSPLFLWHIFINFTENAPFKNFCGVLISFNEVLKLQSFEFDASDIKPANALIVSFYIINFRENNEVSTKFHGVFCHGVIKWESFGWFNYVSTLVTSSTQMNLLNMLILAFMLRFGNFGWWNFFFMMKNDHFKQKLLLSPQFYLKCSWYVTQKV